MRISLTFLTVVALAFPVLSFAAGSGWTDRNEYDLVLNIRSEPNPQKRLQLLDDWNRKYPKSELRQARLNLYLATYESTGDSAHMLDVARQMLADQPAGPVGMYWCTLLLPQAGAVSPELLDTGEKASRTLLRDADRFFAPALKPAATSDADWLTQKKSVELLAHRTLGWIEWQRGNYEPAAKEFTAYLNADPSSAEVSGWLGIVLALDKSKQPAALWHMAHAVAPGDQNTLALDQRRQFDRLLEHVYVSYHGAPDGLDQLRAAAADSVFPPAGLTIESATVIAARRAEEELSRTNPELAAWMRMRKELEGAEGDKYFADSLKDKPLPKLKGTVVRSSPARYPRIVVLAMTEQPTEDVMLKVTSALPNDAEPGTKIEFEGTVESFTKEPFGIAITVDPKKIEGWPERGARRK